MTFSKRRLRTECFLNLLSFSNVGKVLVETASFNGTAVYIIKPKKTSR